MSKLSDIFYPIALNMIREEAITTIIKMALLTITYLVIKPWAGNLWDKFCGR